MWLLCRISALELMMGWFLPSRIDGGVWTTLHRLELD